MPLKTFYVDISNNSCDYLIIKYKTSKRASCININSGIFIHNLLQVTVGLGNVGTFYYLTIMQHRKVIIYILKLVIIMFINADVEKN